MRHYQVFLNNGCFYNIYAEWCNEIDDTLSFFIEGQGDFEGEPNEVAQVKDWYFWLDITHFEQHKKTP